MEILMAFIAGLIVGVATFYLLSSRAIDKAVDAGRIIYVPPEKMNANFEKDVQKALISLRRKGAL